MLKVKTTARHDSRNWAIMEENVPCYGGCFNREEMEDIYHLPEGYDVGYTYKDDNFIYKVIEV